MQWDLWLLCVVWAESCKCSIKEAASPVENSYQEGTSHIGHMYKSMNPHTHHMAASNTRRHRSRLEAQNPAQSDHPSQGTGNMFILLAFAQSWFWRTF